MKEKEFIIKMKSNSIWWIENSGDPKGEEDTIDCINKIKESKTVGNIITTLQQSDVKLWGILWITLSSASIEGLDVTLEMDNIK